MANPSIIPPPAQHKDKGSEPRASGAGTAVDHAAPAALPSIHPSGPRKLVRPTLSTVTATRRFTPRGEPALLAHQSLTDHAIAAAGHDSSHAEVFYFQKQVQTQTLMCFVLDDGERIEGYIEWFDRNAIKIRNGSRILIYKSSIKYLFKASETIR